MKKREDNLFVLLNPNLTSSITTYVRPQEGADGRGRRRDLLRPTERASPQESLRRNKSVSLDLRRRLQRPGFTRQRRWWRTRATVYLSCFPLRVDETVNDAGLDERQWGTRCQWGEEDGTVQGTSKYDGKVGSLVNEFLNEQEDHLRTKRLNRLESTIEEPVHVGGSG